MKKIQVKDVWLFVAQVLLLSLTLLSPGLISYVTSHNPQLAWESLMVSAYWLAPAIAVDKIQKVDRNDCVYIGKEIIHIPDGYLQTFRQFLETRSIEKR